MLQLLELQSMDNSREECLPQTAVAKISAHAAGKGYPRLTFAGSVADADLCKGAGLAEGKSGSKWLRSSTRRGAAGAAQAAKAPVGFFLRDNSRRQNDDTVCTLLHIVVACATY